jgi:hypothetical protein
MGRLKAMVWAMSLGTALLAIAACGQAPPAPADTSEPQQPVMQATVWPAGFVVMGDGYPNPGDPCRRLGESALTADYLDDSAILVGCAGAEGEAAAKALAAATGGQVLARVEGVTMITIPQGDANVGMTPAGDTQPTGE